MMTKTIYRILMTAILVGLVSVGVAKPPSPVAPWKIVVASDWHSAENGVLSKTPEAYENNQAMERRRIAATIIAKPDVVLITGDTCSGHWGFAALKKAGLAQTKADVKKAIFKASKKTYAALVSNFAASGISKLLISTGDHELGDNDWPVGSERAKSVPFYREGFARYVNFDDKGKWKWGEMVCGAPARPMGTIYQDTSFALRHKNALIVTVDIFQWTGANKKLSSQHGAVKADLEGEHLAWFKRVLAAGCADPVVQFIIVQAHTPTLAPFRAARTSRMAAAGMENSAICNAMREHNVDLYLAGEVHVTTVTKDAKSNLVQLITDRSRPTEITVHPDRLELRMFDRDCNVKSGPQTKTVPYIKGHALTIRKGSGKTTLEGSGILVPLDTHRIFIHYPLDTIAPTPISSRYFGSSLTVRNLGGLGFIYDSCSKNTQATAGVIGQAALLGPKSQLFAYAFSPFGAFGKTERTFSVWIKTTSTETANLLLDGSLAMVYQGGKLAIQAGKNPIALKSKPVNDGEWHHVAFVVSPGAKAFGDLTVYLDAKPFALASAKAATWQAKLLEEKHRLSIGCGAVNVWKATGPAAGPGFDGALDEFAAWYRALSPEEIKALYVGAKQGKTASQIDKTFTK